MATWFRWKNIDLCLPVIRFLSFSTEGRNLLTLCGVCAENKTLPGEVGGFESEGVWKVALYADYICRLEAFRAFQ
jgi:hypothetical protein